MLMFSRLTTNGRPYKIHLNLVNDATATDILDSYYFARLLDYQLKKVYEPENRVFTVEHAIRAAEWQFQNEYNSEELR